MAKFKAIVICLVISCACSAIVAEKACDDIHAFLKHTAILMKMLPFHTYPVFNLCTNQTAQHEYGNAIMLYRNMTNTPECKKYLENNHMTVYENIYVQLTGLWDAANCDACASAVNETATFMNLSTNLDNCFATTKTPCESCDTDYQNVQQFYASIEKRQHGSGMCFDIKDRMNQTRRVWSGQYNCCKDKRRSMVIFASIASVVCVLPFAFYLLMHAVTVRQERRRISLLSATSVNDESTPASCSRPNNGTLRNSEMERIEETDGNENNDDDESDYDGESIPTQTATFQSLSKLNNLDVVEGNLIDISVQTSQMHPVLKPLGHNHEEEESEDVNMLK
ncbi:uncharacterized protein LOC128719121 [Anopheles marshallii]|uniref:uncharacterized protein LOC128719121 n=1 Tax=Anopheles marshallii TaxID=1521116 RepID=UPI00237C494A|nr:uncharacterized protein LOC128719121 [Anopheles marshallii]